MGQQYPFGYDPEVDPESRFDTPSALATAAGMSLAEKRDALMRWQDLVRRRLDAGDEGMPTNGRASDDAELVREIGKALLALEQQRGSDDKSRRQAVASQSQQSALKPGREASPSLHPQRTGPFDDPPRRPS